MTLQLFLVIAAALLSVGLYGALSQQSVVMIMMGLELMVNAVLLTGGAFWWFVAPASLDGQVLVLVALVVMAVEMAMGFAPAACRRRWGAKSMVRVALALLVLLPVGSGVLLALAGLGRLAAPQHAGPVSVGGPAAPQHAAKPVGAGASAAVRAAAGPVAVGISAIVLALAVVVAVGRPALSTALLPGARATLAVDGLSAVLVLVVATVTPLVLLFATGDLRTDDARPRFFGLMLVFEGAMLVTVTATSLVVLLAAWEVMGAASYALIAFWWREDRRVESGAVAFLTTRTADLGLYVAAGAALAGTGSLAVADLPAAGGGWLHVAAAGIVLAALGKSAQLPFSFWLSRAMDGPSPVSALLHSATMVAAGGYLLLRVRPLLEATGWAGPTVAWAGALTALLLGAVATAQTDFKQLLAASTAAQIGFVVLAAGVGATAGGTAQLVAHAAVKSALFLAAGAWLTALGTKQLTGLRGVARRYPAVGRASVVALLALAGVPPLSLWATKDSVLAAVAEQSLPLYLVGLAAAVLSAAYAGRAIAVVLDRSRREPTTDQLQEEPPGQIATIDQEEPTGQVTTIDQFEAEPTGQVAAVGSFSVVLLAAAGAALGVLALPAVRERLTDALGGVAPPAGLAELATSGLLAVAVTLLVVRRGGHVVSGRLAAALSGWLALESAARRAVVQPVLRLAHGLARVDDRVLDRAVMAVPGLVRAGARGLAGADDGGIDRVVEGSVTLTRRTADRPVLGGETAIDGAVAAVARMTAALGRLARRPQTGQLHQYYAQAAAAIAVLAVLVIVVR